MITQPTRVTDHSATLIDNIFVSKPGNVISGNIVSDLSDHFPIFCVAKQALVGGGEHHDPVTFKYRVHNEFTLNLLYSRIANTNFDSVLNSHDINVALSQFYDILYDIYDTCCPIRIKTLSSKDIQKPWITRDILNIIKRRNILFLLHRNGKVSREACNRYIQELCYGTDSWCQVEFKLSLKLIRLV